MTYANIKVTGKRLMGVFEKIYGKITSVKWAVIRNKGVLYMLMNIDVIDVNEC